MSIREVSASEQGRW